MFLHVGFCSTQSLLSKYLISPAASLLSHLLLAATCVGQDLQPVPLQPILAGSLHYRNTALHRRQPRGGGARLCNDWPIVRSLHGRNTVYPLCAGAGVQHLHIKNKGNIRSLWALVVEGSSLRVVSILQVYGFYKYKKRHVRKRTSHSRNEQ